MFQLNCMQSTAGPDRRHIKCSHSPAVIVAVTDTESGPRDGPFVVPWSQSCNRNAGTNVNSNGRAQQPQQMHQLSNCLPRQSRHNVHQKAGKGGQDTERPCSTERNLHWKKLGSKWKLSINKYNMYIYFFFLKINSNPNYYNSPVTLNKFLTN